MISLFLQLFWTFFLIGMFTFGGGYAVIGVIQSESWWPRDGFPRVCSRT